jgi:hypothetical protein
LLSLHCEAAARTRHPQLPGDPHCPILVRLDITDEKVCVLLLLCCVPASTHDGVALALLSDDGHDSADLSELSLAWAVTIHKSQGSEYPIVILPLFMQHYVLLSRNLLYTGLTKAKQLAILVGQQKAIGFAVKQMSDRQRYTALADRLRQRME